MKKIFVTRPSIPDKKKFNKYINHLYKTRILTTQGKFVPMLENKLIRNFFFYSIKELLLGDNIRY